MLARSSLHVQPASEEPAPGAVDSLHRCPWSTLAALPGFIDWAVGIPTGTPAKSRGLTHMLLNVVALVLFIINAVIHTGDWDTPSGSGSGIILALLGVLCTVAAGYFGWTMIQTDHVGVELTPQQERLEQGARPG